MTRADSERGDTTTGEHWRQKLIDSLRTPRDSVAHRLRRYGLDERPSLSDDEAATLVEQIESDSERLSADD